MNNTKATVLVLSTSSGPGGAERVISTLSSALNQEQFRVIVALFRPGWLQAECERLGVETQVIPLAGPLHIKWFFRCWQLVRREQVRLIHAHEFSALLCGWIVSILARVPLMGTIHGKNYYWERFRRRMACRIVARTGRMIAVSEDLKRFMMSKVGIHGSRVQVIYNGVTPAPSISESDVHRCRGELGIKTGDLVIGTVGSLYPVKGHQYLLGAMPAVLERFPTAVLLLIGRGDLEVALKDQAKKLGIEGQVRFLGMRQDVPLLLAVMDIFVLPSLSEGLSMALLEAMVTGKAVVATRVGGNSELIEPGKTGILVENASAGELSSALITMCADPVMRRQVGRAAADRALRHFSRSRMVEGYRDLYGRMLKIAA